ncbi:SDR family NAD(P)-dependent oxidoreductase [Fulvivirgaceae bacterium BMA12]|uniref:SDR family NAD(P)-dependent oxidoreductase n=1 Tax=Agaribacillus aureus TaxID=3051825 RepID=A0ABT8L1F6_9BACT|nr:SDR family NAD(P)-dependent oxidoreductase [Fulvivirgaceae bacterium BMA12]
MQLTKNKVLITGGSTGIGLALASAFTHLGNTVITVDRNPENQQNALETLPALITYQCDLAKPEAIETLISWIENNHPDLNILINNAGVQFNYLFRDETSVFPRIEREVNVNLMAPVKLSTALLPVLCNQESSAIINITSALAFAPKPNASVYCATKAALHNFSQSLRYQLEAGPVKVFEIIPPLVATKMTTGRGKNKITPDQLAGEFMTHFENDRFEVNIGKVKLLRGLLRIYPGFVYRLLKKT